MAAEVSEMEVETNVGETVKSTELPQAELENDAAVTKDDEESDSFPSIAIEINSAETISKDAFEEDKTDEAGEALFQDYDADLVDTDPSLNVEITPAKEQEPVNESSESDGKALEDTVIKGDNIKQEAETEGDIPNEDPNRDAADSDQEMDPEVAAALEASLLDTEQMGDEEQENDDTPAPPVMMFRNETELDSADDDDDTADPDVVTENAVTGDEMTLDGEAVTGDMETGVGNPLDSLDGGNPLIEEDPGDYDPLVEDNIVMDPETSGFLDKVNSGFMTQIHAFPDLASGSKRGPRGPYKKKNKQEGESDFEDDDFDPLDPTRSVKKKPVKKKSSPRGTLQCNICHQQFTSSIGELKLHKFTDHNNQAKPSYLDLAEVAIDKNSKQNGGVSTQKILKAILADPTTCSDSNVKAKNILNRALKAGLSTGRLRSGKPGKKCQRYFLSKKGPTRKGIFDKYNKNKKLVEFDDHPPKKPPAVKPAPTKKLQVPPTITVTKLRSSAPKPSPKHADSIGIPNTNRFGRGKRGGGLAITLDSSSDDDIEIVSEKITAKPKRVVKVVRVPANRASGSSKPGSSKLPSNLVRVGGSRPGMQGSSISRAPAKKKEEAKKTSLFDEDDEDLSCKVCHQAFWFKSQLEDHMNNSHRNSPVKK